jgi:transcriptional regulator with XRE-family HTH domain
MVQIPRLREWREARALTQVELAELADVSSRSVAGYEAGAGARPATIRKLAVALGVEVADLRGDPDSPKAEASPWQQPPLNGMLAEERRTPTFAELHAIETLKGHRDHLEEFLETAKQRDIAPIFWVIEADHTIDMAAVGLAFLEREHLRPLLLPTAARLVELAYEVFDGLRDAEAEEEAERRREAIRPLEEAVA